ncbi:putative serine threonine-kinase [Clavispora lusitaniae]|uniref:Serine threonine-kinase n=1 Tax=Clavispora lusitaniae TaxID=36911 RepID=A0ACD0WRA1_CLALS|nr:putative serine threonine-kinase [Clavispora lusitaniae]QFZ35465.1 putative serine threonine-kinase [Clavispora lusitaniae]QFZ41159.1 putative serine threonine-kinase [Clavispora lusitaniae]QFZ46840.1 putative serine threonine-kinase [Clavispora lusitaniae]QFZ52505.1 putative serine threonine-kinase [Clavispora lusitaniae]
MTPQTRMQEQNQTAQLAAQFNKFYLETTTPEVNQIGNYSIVSEIGEGAFGKVYLAQHILLGCQVVLKCGLVDDPNIVREIYYHRQLRHKNIVKLYEVVRTETHLWMVLEYCEGNELYHYIYEQKRLDIDVCRHLFYQIVEAMRYVHSLNLCHRDLKLENILLADTKRTVVKLTDFGFVREFSPYKRTFLSTVCGTTAYMAPEVLKSEKYSGFAVDIWSMGVILYAMVYGELPFDEDDVLKTKYCIINSEPSFRGPPQPEAAQLIRKMLSKDPNARPSLTEILNSPFLIDITNEKMAPKTPVNDTESVMSINQHYRLHSMPFQSKIERHLLKKMEKLNMDVDRVQAAVFSGQSNPLTAFYELALAQEFKKKRTRYMRKKRYYEAKRSLKKQRQRMRSALSLNDQASMPPLEKILSSLSISSRQTDREERGERTSSRQSKISEPETSKVEGADQKTTANITDRPVQQKPERQFERPRTASLRSVSFYERPSERRGFLNRLQFWKRNKLEADISRPVARSLSRRPESVVSQNSQYSTQSHMSALSESEADLLATDDEYFDDGSESSLSTQMRLSYRRIRPRPQRLMSDSSVSRLKRSSMSQVSSNSSEESSALSRIADRLDDRPPSPQTKKRARNGHFKMPMPGRPVSPPMGTGDNNAFRWPEGNNYDTSQVDPQAWSSSGTQVLHKFIKIEEEDEEADHDSEPEMNQKNEMV